MTFPKNLRTTVAAANDQEKTLLRAFQEIFTRFGLIVNEGAEPTRLVLSFDSEISLTALKRGQCVIQLEVKASSETAGKGLRQYAPDRFRLVSGLSTAFAQMTAALSELKQELVKEYEFDGSGIADDSMIQDKNILVVDDTLLNRDIAKAQLAVNNTLTRASSYITAMQTLKSGSHFDFILTDLILPSEGHQLVEGAMQQIGTPIAAGLYLAMAGIQAKVQDIIVLTDGDHHQDANVAAFSFLNTFDHRGSGVSFVNSRETVNGGKDWSAAIRKHMQN